MVKKTSYSKELSTLLYINLAVLVLLLSMLNLTFSKKKEVRVLGETIDNTYWEELVKKHPTYRDAWMELGRMDKVEEIDPNYIP